MPDEQDTSSAISFTDAAEHILLQSKNREPLHYKDITEHALDEGLIHSQGLTPPATMSTAIKGDIRRREERGETPRFVLHGRGLVGLVSWLPVGVAAQIEENNQQVRQALLERARSTDPTDFEILIGELLSEMGLEDIEVTRPSSDGGVDVRGTLVVDETVRIRMAVQVKRQKNNVPAPIVQQLRGSLGTHDQGIIITTSDFSSGAKEEAIRSDAQPIALISGEQLAALLAKYEIGARAQRYDLLTLEDGGSSLG